MNFRTFSSDRKLIERISKSIKLGNISHAYIIEGDLSVDKMEFTLSFVKAILCKNDIGYGCDSCIMCRKIDHNNLEDLYFVSKNSKDGKSTKSVKDEDIEEAQRMLKNKPNLERNILIISDADTMTIRAQNRLLKTLEEPTDGTVIFLLSENSENLLPTIRSRAIKYHIYGNLNNDNDLTFEKELLDLVLTNSSFLTLKEKLSEIKSSDDALKLLDNLEKVCRNMLLENMASFERKRKEKIYQIINLIEEARKDLYMKCNYQYVLKNLVIKI